MDLGNCRVQVFTSEGAFLSQWGTCGSAPGQFASPIWIAGDATGNVYVFGQDNYRIVKYGSRPGADASLDVGKAEEPIPVI